MLQPRPIEPLNLELLNDFSRNDWNNGNLLERNRTKESR